MPRLYYLSDPVPYDTDKSNGECEVSGNVVNQDTEHVMRALSDHMEVSKGSCSESLAILSIGDWIENDVGNADQTALSSRRYVASLDIKPGKAFVRNSRHSKACMSLEEYRVNEEVHLEMQKLQSKNKKLMKKLEEASNSAKSFQAQQRKLYDGFKVLRRKYDDMKNDVTVTMWEYIPKIVEGFGEITEPDHSIYESSTRIGAYKIGELLGEGQFADVKIATKNDSDDQLAVKIMRKDKVQTMQGLKRVQNEIAVLKRICHQNIVKFVNVIFSSKHVYLFGEYGAYMRFS